MTPFIDLSTPDRRVRRSGIEAAFMRDLFERPDITTPQLLLSRSAIAENYRALKAALPRASIHYAVKPNNHELFIEEVARLGGNFDVCSAGEIDIALDTGINPATLVHSHPIKSLQEFDYAVGEGVEIFVVDNPDEIRKLSRYTHKKLKLLIRFRCHTNHAAVVNLQYKFGCETSQVIDLARLVEKSGHEFYGLCFHVGSQCVHNENYVKAIEVAHGLINELDLTGFDTRVLDIGGGFPVEYVEAVAPMEEFCKPIACALDKHIRPGIVIISEPGRAIAATPVTLVTSVVGKAFRDGKMWYYLDDGLYSTFSGIVYDQCQYPVICHRRGEQRLSVLAGPTCDSFDVMYDGLMIPEHEVGDRILFAATGAYCSVSGSNFNALKHPEYTVVD
ncbi:MAG: type III PLP-dependent enzyme [candidate division Zixibacteria bacterium]|nr:type III PLP-dependent enzyme [candidate division Zixibacteria bacterium]